MNFKRIPNQIIKEPLIPLIIKNVDSIAFHHMAHETWDVKDVEKYHVFENGWDAIGYNYWIAFDGTIYEGRGLNIGAGVLFHNSHILSIGLQGDFEKQMPTDEQYKSARELVYFLKEKIPGIKNIGCHRDWNATACPGKNFDIKKITEYNDMEAELKKLKEEIDSLKNDINTLKESNEALLEAVQALSEPVYNWVTACPEWSRSYVHKALELGILKGDSKGQLNLKLSDIRHLVFLLRATNTRK